MSAEAVDSSDVQALKEQLLTRSKALFTSNDLWVIAVALNLAQAAHEGQQRKHGAAYLTHPLRVALILLDEFQVRQAVAIAAALLHDVLEDAADRCGRGNIEAMCGPEVAGLLEILTAPPKSAFPNKADRNREKANKVLAAPTIAWQIKLADRVDNVRDACSLNSSASSKQFRARYHYETTAYYLPMAERLGDPRVLHCLVSALAKLREQLITDALIPTQCLAAEIELDLTRMYLPPDVAERYHGLLMQATEEMAAVERGEKVNCDEGRAVGHYWLRSRGPGPVPCWREIQAMHQSIETFCRDHVTGTGTGDETDEPRPEFRKLLLIGIGGSALGPQMLYEALRTPGKTPLLFTSDNTDPSGIGRTLQEIELAGGLDDTLVIVVSKSGGTKETRNGMLVAQEAFQRANLSFAEHAVAVTQPGSPLDKIASGSNQAGHAPWLGRFPLWEWVGGRTSLCSAVGLLPAALLGFDWRELLEGARTMDHCTRSSDLSANLALALATTWYHAVEVLGLRNMVILPYCDRLALLGRYLQQLVMESLGKAGKGITVYGNKGSTDQHSYVQQLRDGYRDFFVTFLRYLEPEPGLATDLEVDEHVHLFDYLAAFQEGTAQALSDTARLSLRITIEKPTERSLGALVALFERAVGYYGAMLGINAYDQPGVEAGKRAADQFLKLQQRLVEYLQSHAGTPHTAQQLADAMNASPLVVRQTLDRLCRTHQQGLQAVPCDALEAGSVSFLYPC